MYVLHQELLELILAKHFCLLINLRARSCRDAMFTRRQRAGAFQDDPGLVFVSHRARAFFLFLPDFCFNFFFNSMKETYLRLTALVELELRAIRAIYARKNLRRARFDI